MRSIFELVSWSGNSQLERQIKTAPWLGHLSPMEVTYSWQGLTTSSIR